MYSWKGVLGLLSDLGHIVCFSSVLDHMCGAQVSAEKGEHMLVNVMNCTVKNASLSFSVSQLLSAPFPQFL